MTAVGKGSLSFAVVICAYTERRWDDLCAAVASVQAQTVQARELIVVVDHNPVLARRAERELAGVIVVENEQAPGLSGARNRGIQAATASLIAFLDDDAVADERWLETLLAAFSDRSVLGAGGSINPLWLDGRPGWFPDEFNWVVGCTYRGMPEQTAPVRNMIGCNMAFRREVFDEIGGFTTGIGRVGTLPVGCEETELCIRVRQRWPAATLLFEPRARVEHRVPVGRTSWRYFLRRCYAEGLSKALVADAVGARDGLSTERAYTLRVLPRGVIRGLTDAVLRGNLAGVGRAAAIVAGLACTSVGYARGKSQTTGRTSPVAGVSALLRHRVGTGSGHVLPANAFTPLRLLEVELSRPLPPIPRRDRHGGEYTRASLLVRLHTEVVGAIELVVPEEGVSAARLAATIWEELGSAITSHLQHDGLAIPRKLGARGLPARGTPKCLGERAARLARAPMVTVVIPTRDREESLSQTIVSLLAQEYRDYEVLVVDNASAGDATHHVVASFADSRIPVRCTREDRPGLSRAKNRGLLEARGEVVAFTDDDVLADAHWLAELVRGFEEPQVACVTGLILPMEMETPAQGLIEQFGGFSKGFQRRLYDLAEHRLENPLYPYAAGVFGSGANMAFRTETLRALGGFDPALGAGSPAVGGEDLAVAVDTLMAGYQVAYEPSAIIRHAHRRDYGALRRQVRGYGVGLSAYLTRTVVKHPRAIVTFAVRLPAAVAYTFGKSSGKNRNKRDKYPGELTRDELRGMLRGPVAYLRARVSLARHPSGSDGPAIPSRPSGPLVALNGRGQLHRVSPEDLQLKERELVADS